jgi:hypothetical protein
MMAPARPTNAPVGEPLTFNSALSLEGKTQAKLDQGILDEIKGHIHGGVQGIFEKYFESKCWTASVDEGVQAAAQDKQWSANIPELFSTSAGGRSIFKSHVPEQRSHFFPQGISQRFLISTESAREGEYGWADVQVVGQFQVNPGHGYVPGFLHLYRCAREVFRKQPTRLFLHGFYVFGSEMELWMFDRSGLYGSEPFNVQHGLEQLITIVTGYTRMSDAELGINSLILLDDMGKYILAEGKRC